MINTKLLLIADSKSILPSIDTDNFYCVYCE